MTEDASRSGWIERGTWGFLLFGVGLRLGRYALNFPIWWDEAFVAVNFLRRGYLDLLRPLDYGQVCPLLFLWSELLAVRILGFAEGSLRLLPVLSGVSSLLLIRHVAGRIAPGVPRLLATALLAVSFYPNRHAVDIKPYASDLMASLVLIAVAVEWLRDRDRTAWLAALVVVGPIAVAWSYPAIFVAGGVGFALIVPAWKTGRWSTRGWLVGYGAATCAAFGALYGLITQGQARAVGSAMGAEWAASFPPWRDPGKLVVWLISTHTGDLFAYPFGASRPASTITLALFVVGVAVLWRSGRRAIAILGLAPFALAILAAAIRAFPYGGEAHGGSSRFMQYLAPIICIIVGIGADDLLKWIKNPGRRRRVFGCALLTLFLGGLVPFVADCRHPYRSPQAQAARDFARDFWPRAAREAQVVCLRWDEGFGGWDSIHLDRAVDLCDQAIYSPARWSTPPPRERLRFVLCDAQPEEQPAIARWREAMRRDFDPEAIHSARGGRFLVFDFRRKARSEVSRR